MQKVRLAKHMPHFSTWQEERDAEMECAPFRYHAATLSTVQCLLAAAKACISSTLEQQQMNCRQTAGWPSRAASAALACTFGLLLAGL